MATQVELSSSELSGKLEEAEKRLAALQIALQTASEELERVTVQRDEMQCALEEKKQALQETKDERDGAQREHLQQLLKTEGEKATLVSEKNKVLPLCPRPCPSQTRASILVQCCACAGRHSAEGGGSAPRRSLGEIQRTGEAARGSSAGAADEAAISGKAARAGSPNTAWRARSRAG